jgi:hypothetical protein
MNLVPIERFQVPNLIYVAYVGSRQWLCWQLLLLSNQIAGI